MTASHVTVQGAGASLGGSVARRAALTADSGTPPTPVISGRVVVMGFPLLDGWSVSSPDPSEGHRSAAAALLG